MSSHNIRILRLTEKNEAATELKKIGVDPAGVTIMSGKTRHYNIKVSHLDLRQANIIKQQMLSLGADVAVHRNVINSKVDYTDAIIMATEKQLQRGFKKFRLQPFGVKELADEIEAVITTDEFSTPPLTCGAKTFDFSEKTHVMGILNVTPDSFSDGGYFCDIRTALTHVERMINEGADFIDIGGESTKPGAKPVPLEEELKRVIPVITEIKKNFFVPVSVDTYKADVAKRALDAGADMINDISAMRFDPEMKKTVADAGVPVILMHIKGTPRDMQKNPKYDCVVTEIFDYLKEAVDEAEAAGIKSKNIIIDPGIGFGKLLDHNTEILKKLSEFKALRKAIMIGVSRKSFIGQLTGADATDRLNGSTAANVVSVINGANLLRVHDVKETIHAIKIAEALK